jgi:hypothetical protein
MYAIQQKTGIEYPTCIDGIWMSRKSTCLLDSMMENFASEVGVIEAIFVEVQPQIQNSRTSIDRITKQPLIIINWTYIEMMVWMSRKSICLWNSIIKKPIFPYSSATKPDPKTNIDCQNK